MKTSELSSSEQRMLQRIAATMQLSGPAIRDREFGDAGLEEFLRDVLNQIELTRNALRTTTFTLLGPQRDRGK